MGIDPLRRAIGYRYLYAIWKAWCLSQPQYNTQGEAISSIFFSIEQTIVALKWLSTATFSYKREHKHNMGVQRPQLAFTQTVIVGNGN